MSAARPDATGADPQPLARLFAIAYRDLVERLHERLRARGWHDVRPAFGFVLLSAREHPTSTSELANLAGSTKQAASKLAATMTEAGYLEQRGTGDDARRRPLYLTAKGRRLLADVEAVHRELEAEWAETIGAPAVDRLRRDVTRMIHAHHEGELPPIRPTW